MKKIIMSMAILLISLFAMPVMAQETTPEVPVIMTEGGNPISVIEAVRLELQPILLLVFFTALATGAWALIEVLRGIRNRNTETFTVVLDGVEFVVTKITKFTTVDDRLFSFLRKRIESPEPSEINELYEEINNANK